MKESLLRMKRALERKCFASNTGSEYPEELYLDVIKNINNEDAVECIQEFITNTIIYCQKRSIDFEQTDLFLTFSLYFDQRYADKIKPTTKPIPELLRISIAGAGYENNSKLTTIDPDNVSEDIDYVITFDDFKEMLEKRGLTLEYNSYEEVLNDYRNKKNTSCRITKTNQRRLKWKI